MEHDNTNKGVLYRNDRRRNDKDPSHQGSINIEGAEYWLSAWVKENSKNGSKFFSMAVRPKEPQVTKPQPAERLEDQDDIPF